MIVSNTINNNNTTLYTATKSTAVVLIVLCNTNPSSAKVSLHAVGENKTPSDENILLKDLVMSVSRTFVFNVEKIILSAGDSIVAKSDIGGVAATISGMVLE